VKLIKRELKVGFLGHEKDGSVYGIDSVRHDKLRETFQRVVTRGWNTLHEWLWIDMKMGRTVEAGYYSVH
jgi:hypothetical protein